MPDGLVIRVSVPEDLPTLQRIRAAAFAPVFRSFRMAVGPDIAGVAFAHEEADQAKLLDALCRADSDHTILVAKVEGAVIGFVSFRVDAVRGVGEIGLNAVHPDHTGQGVGTRMYLRALEAMRRSGATVATVGTGGDAAHAPARRAYEKAGFAAGIPSVHLYRLL